MNAPENVNVQDPEGIYELYKDNILLLADKIEEAERIQRESGIQRGFEIGITEVGKKPTPPSHIFYFLYYLFKELERRNVFKELERRNVSLKPTLAEAQIGTIHGYGAENLARRDLLRNVAAMMGIFHVGEAAHGTSGTTRETLALYPDLGVAHAHIFTDFVVAEFRAMLEHNPELFLRYSLRTLEHEKTRAAFDKKARPKYKQYNSGRPLSVRIPSYSKFIMSGRAAESVRELVEQLDTLTPEEAGRFEYCDSLVCLAAG